MSPFEVVFDESTKSFFTRHERAMMSVAFDGGNGFAQEVSSIKELAERIAISPDEDEHEISIRLSTVEDNIFHVVGLDVEIVISFNGREDNSANWIVKLSR